MPPRRVGSPMGADERLAGMGIALPEPPAPAGAYAPVSMSGCIAFVSGQLPAGLDGRIAHTGKVGDGNAGEAAEAARLCAINVLAQLRAALGSLERVERVVRVAAFVNSEPGFAAHPAVADAASDVFFGAFGERGRHARIAVGAASLPLNAMVEIEAAFEVSGGPESSGPRARR